MVAACLAFRAGLVVSLRFDGSRRLANLENSFEGHDFGTLAVRCSARAQCTLELAVLRMAFGRVVVRGHRAPLDPDCLHDCVLLAHLPNCSAPSLSLYNLGDFRICAELDPLADESERAKLAFPVQKSKSWI